MHVRGVDRLRARKPVYRSVAVGGTFDVFHKGHEEFLIGAFSLGERVFIGVTSDRLVRALKKSHRVQPYKLRIRGLRRFLRSRGWTGRATIASLEDQFGPARTRKTLEALVVTPNTLSSGRRLNVLRKRAGLKPVAIRQVRLTRARDGKPISSTRVRNREVDRNGRIIKKSAKMGEARSASRLGRL
jgi:pantetheine-phosphate adenylyltransferase